MGQRGADPVEAWADTLESLADGEVGPAVAHVLHRLHDRSLEPECARQVDEGRNERPEPAERQDEEDVQRQEGGVDDDREHEEMAPVRLVEPPGLVEHALERSHGSGAYAPYAAAAQSPYSER